MDALIVELINVRMAELRREFNDRIASISGEHTHEGFASAEHAHEHTHEDIAAAAEAASEAAEAAAEAAEEAAEEVEADIEEEEEAEDGAPSAEESDEETAPVMDATETPETAPTNTHWLHRRVSLGSNA